MKLHTSPNKLATIYSVASVFLGPLIYMLGFRFTRGGGDYCDAVYDLPNGGIDPRRAIEFHHEQLFQVTGASFMFAIGLALLAYIFLRAHKKQTKLNIWAVIAVLTMMFGYVVVILSSGSSGQNC